MTELSLQERDRIATRRIAIISIGSLGVGAAGVVLSTILGLPFHGHEAEPPRAATQQIGIVEQSLIESTERGIALRRAQQQDLQSYGFNDDQHKTAKIPIERAMRIVSENPR
ncbi:MAG: hypothetical protein ABI461_21330 [Polyangiaceae bacterium]